ncbi:hypothetical protein DAPPUDRAFT_115239 [Daphnia pulex]|uniref:Uncharacterized protein n=1 Tax=Daphnia pulex TaxID=6669 RepID=E9HKP6_DAPPU|nr:hypothetical protein DAPPUDRAFT_115239 [Daphnia pulex]|eukprot:EFX67695.1 hypothetical protein DAPPUDRAFT_115239 [Daphnia pulex]
MEMFILGLADEVLSFQEVVSQNAALPLAMKPRLDGEECGSSPGFLVFSLLLVLADLALDNQMWIKGKFPLTVLKFSMYSILQEKLTGAMSTARYDSRPVESQKLAQKMPLDGVLWFQVPHIHDQHYAFCSLQSCFVVHKGVAVSAVVSWLGNKKF